MDKLTFGKDARNFVVAEFLDMYGQKCSIQKSSIATEDVIWLGVDNTGPHLKGPSWEYGEDVNARMHLTQEQVRDQLLPALQHFVETGELPK